MDAPHDQQRSLHTAAGDVPLHEYHLREAGRAWAILHAGAVLSYEEEARAIGELREHLPYGVGLWPAAIALAHEVLARADSFRDRRVLELGAGTGLPGIVAASLGARVVQTDRDTLALDLCRRNGARNGLQAITYRQVDWAVWDDAEQYDWILGADILYGETTHPYLRQIFQSNLAPGGRILLADPFRAVSFQLLEALEAEGWTVAVSKWQVGGAAAPRPVGLFELAPPG
jgi:predicted nicotinamide N-methyase